MIKNSLWNFLLMVLAIGVKLDQIIIDRHLGGCTIVDSLRLCFEYRWNYYQLWEIRLKVNVSLCTFQPIIVVYENISDSKLIPTDFCENAPLC